MENGCSPANGMLVILLALLRAHGIPSDLPIPTIQTGFSNSYVGLRAHEAPSVMDASISSTVKVSVPYKRNIGVVAHDGIVEVRSATYKWNPVLNPRFGINLLPGSKSSYLPPFLLVLTFSKLSIK